MEQQDELWQQAHTQARRWLRRFPDVWTRENRDDLAQEASIAAWRWAKGVRHRERFWSAVQTITSRIRSRARRNDRRLVVQQGLADDAPAVDRGADERHWSVAGRRVPEHRLRPWLRAALARLRPIDRQLLALFYEGFCCAELAERLRRSEACIKTRLHRARRRIQRQVEASARAAGGLEP
jgi:RNA polymerase sigma factor (sigma-70 family)